MARRPRRNHSPAFKAKAAVAAIKAEKTLIELAQEFDAWIPARSATASNKADFDTLAKLGQDRLEGRFIPQALSWREIGGDDDLLDVAIG